MWVHNSTVWRVVKQRHGKMSKTFIGGAICREFESKSLAAEEMLDCVVCSSKQLFSDVP